MVAVAAGARQDEPRERRRFDAPNFLWYFGAVVALAATTFFVNQGWERWSAGTMLAASSGYLAAYAAGSWALYRRRWRVPGGLLATLAVSVVPLVVYAFERLTGWWPEDQPRAYEAFHQEILAAWIAMELVTIAAGLVTIWLTRFPLVSAPIAFTTWYLSMDLAPAFFGKNVTSDERAAVSIVVGLVLVGVGLVLDRRGLRRFAFWNHLFGLLTLLGSICWLTVDHYDHTTWAIVTAVSFFTVLLAVPLGRATYVVFGALGLVSASCYWSHEVFETSPWFPFVVSLVGMAFFALGLVIRLRGDLWRERLIRRLRRSPVVT